jgi:2',3'-cyclic-nucleotide 2'-phosphodiesterase/3'-nucleotidase
VWVAEPSPFFRSAAPPTPPERARVTVLATTDLHGRVFPINYGNDQPSADGLARIATLTRAARKEAPDLLLVDCAEHHQAAPRRLLPRPARINNGPIDPMMLADRYALGYTAA